MTFDYLERVIVEGQLDVDNIGDCVIQGNNDFGELFFLIIKTELGWTEVLEYAPIIPDIQLLPINYQINYSRFEYNQGKLERLIDKFLNNPKRIITQAKVITIEEIRDLLVNPIDRMFPIIEEDLFDE